MSANEKITWMDSPWRILLDVTKLERIKVWEVQLTRVLRDFTKYLQERGYVDFNLCGIVVLSAATIHRIKTQRLLQQDSPPQPREAPNLIIPEPIQVPFKPETYTTTLRELVEALHEALMQVVTEKTSRTGYVVEESRVELAEFLINFEEELEKFIEEIRRILAERGSITFSELVKGKRKIDAAKTFILLLFAAARDVVILLQEEASQDIIITPGW
ncbi:MAG TPA: hypothetical protein EYH45_06355 [Candidatus Caldiarchaeum subterraneum]|uniref:Chromosome segregation and condensation protein ScpA n=1 Tax=Caldiarchaeum subterraneum TaxID=311458 RepID=A0A833A513_CALS0|nr:hypothetical protein [Aigarchaeota archaeon]HIQ30168.1 hypothetical protein [Candidatus Caldarchaeum subterraneum]